MPCCLNLSGCLQCLARSMRGFSVASELVGCMYMTNHAGIFTTLFAVSIREVNDDLVSLPTVLSSSCIFINHLICLEVIEFCKRTSVTAELLLSLYIKVQDIEYRYQSPFSSPQLAIDKAVA